MNSSNKLPTLLFHLKSASFVSSSPVSSKLPPCPYPEICLLGRSNAGKSSLINHLAGQKKIARTSSTPGQTRHLNLFNIRYSWRNILSDGSADRAARVSTKHDHESFIRLIDTPGYGYAKVAKSERFSVERDILQPIVDSPSLKIICLLIDCRRTALEDELTIQKVAFATGRLLLVIATKVDTLNQKEKLSCLRALADSFHLTPEDLVLSGRDTAAQSIWMRMLEPIHLGDI